MWRLVMFCLGTTLSLSSLAYGMSPAEARTKLEQMGVQFSEDTFVAKAKDGDLAAVELFLAAGMHVDVKDKKGSDAMLAATARGHLPVVEALLAHGAEVNAKLQLGVTYLMIAAFNGHVPVVQAFLAQRAEVL